MTLSNCIFWVNWVDVIYIVNLYLHSHPVFSKFTKCRQVGRWKLVIYGSIWPLETKNEIQWACDNHINFALQASFTFLLKPACRHALRRNGFLGKLPRETARYSLCLLHWYCWVALHATACITDHSCTKQRHGKLSEVSILTLLNFFCTYFIRILVWSLDL